MTKKCYEKVEPNFGLDGDIGVELLPLMAAPVIGLRDSDQNVPLHHDYVKGHIR